MAFSSKIAGPAPPAEQSIGCLIFFALLWTGFVLVFDGAIGLGIFQQIRASRFPTAPGRVTQSRVESHRGSKGGITYSPKIAYTYRVDGKDYQGSRYHYMNWSSSDDSARRIVNAFPVGRKIEVFYAPGDPTNAVLQAGISGSDLVIVMLISPFNLVMLGLWWMIGASIYRRALPAPAGGAKIVDDGFTTRVRLSSISPLLVGAVTLAVLDFVGMFFVLVTMGMNPPLQNLFVVWGGIFIAALITTAIGWKKSANSDNDLVIDDSGRHLTLPVSFGRTESLNVPLNKSLAIDVEQIVRRGSKGGTYFRYAPTLVLTDHDGAERREKLAEWSSATDAAALAAWLRERLRLPSPQQAADGYSK